MLRQSGMSKSQSELIAVGELRVGMFIELDMGWMSHPFPMSSFRISSGQQIETIRKLGLAQVRYVPEKSDAGSLVSVWQPTQPGAAEVESPIPPRPEPSQVEEEARRQRGHDQLRQARCERRFQETAALYRLVQEQAQARPQEVKTACDTMMAGLLAELLQPGDVTIRLLAGGGGGRAAAHAANVTVLSLLLGKAMGLSPVELKRLGTAAFLHDLGKVSLPERVRSLDDYFSVSEYKLYQDHVAHGVELGQMLGLPRETLLAMAQHHELIDGSGFPRKSQGESVGRLGRILAVTNRYDNLCNPVHPATALTPHEAMSSLYSQMKGRLDERVLKAFIRMMGVYPPGTVVQLNDGRHAMVMAANASRALKPRVLVHDPRMPRREANVIDLEQALGLGIRRGIKPAHLSLESADYLMPRQRVCYFFEPAESERLAA